MSSEVGCSVGRGGSHVHIVCVVVGIGWWGSLFFLGLFFWIRLSSGGFVWESGVLLLLFCCFLSGWTVGRCFFVRLVGCPGAGCFVRYFLVHKFFFVWCSDLVHGSSCVLGPVRVFRGRGVGCVVGRAKFYCHWSRGFLYESYVCCLSDYGGADRCFLFYWLLFDLGRCFCWGIVCSSFFKWFVRCRDGVFGCSV